MKKRVISFLTALTVCCSLTAVNLSSNAGELLETMEATQEASKEEHKENPNVSAEYADSSLFDISKVHTINLLIDDENWDSLIANAENKEYADCDVEIDGELIQNVSIRPKGNASLRSIAKKRDKNNTHFSFKIEFDHKDDETTYHGLDKLALNNLGQDLTCMKDFLTYTMMNDMDVNTPLCSYTLIQKNGEDFGLYLAVEAVEDSFVKRNYGESDVDLYKPETYDKIDHSAQSSLPVLMRIMNGSMYADKTPDDRVDIFNDYWGGVYTEVGYTEEFGTVPCCRWAGSDMNAYNDLWEESVFDCTEQDKTDMLNSIDKLNNGKTNEEKLSVLDTDQLMRYFVVHNFVNNNDGITGIMKHNFFICENDGVLSYVPWDYNIAFGGMHFQNSIRDIIGSNLILDMTPTRLSNIMSVEKDMINFPIDTPLYTGDNTVLPMLSAWLDTDEGKEEYHKLYDEFITKFENGEYEALFQQTREIIQPYVEKELTFYTSEQFKEATDNMELYLQYRSQAIRGQLDGSIPSTKDGQADKPESLIDPEGLETYKMSTSDGTATAPPPEFLNPIITAFLGEDEDKSVGHFSDLMIDYYQNPTTMYHRVPELMQVDACKGSAVKIINAKYGVNSLCFSQHGKPEQPNLIQESEPNSESE